MNYDNAPILKEYNFPTVDPKKPAFKVQKITAAMLTTEKRGYVLNDLGTGKTRCVLWTFDYLRRKKLANKMLVIAPLSTLNRVWESEIALEFNFDYAVLHGSKEKRLYQLRRNVDIYIINHDGVATIISELQARKDIDVVCIDELATYRNPTQR